MNTSATGGFLHLPPVPGQSELEDVLHELIAGITGLPARMIRPRFQDEPPAEPDTRESWCAFGITNTEPLSHEVIHHPQGEGHNELVVLEQLTVLTSFYGPESQSLVKLLWGGIHVSQNRASLRSNGLAFIKTGSITPVPGQVQAGWRARQDLPLIFNHETRRSHSAMNLLQCGSCDGFITSESVVVPLACRKERS